MNAPILVLGGSGMLGHKVFQRLRASLEGVECTLRVPATGAAARSGLFSGHETVVGVDARRWDSVDSVLSRRSPRWVVNCIGVVKQRDDANSAELCIEVNSLLPHKLANRVRAWGGRLIHFSTDCVFSGRRGDYTEVDASDAEDLYGKTKALGEVGGAHALTLRTSMIGRELAGHRSLLDWLLGQRGRTVRGFTRHFYSGVTTLHLADLVATIIERESPLEGLFQVTAPRTSKHDLLCMLRDAYRLDVAITPDDTTHCDRSMLGERFDTAFGRTAPNWQSLITELAHDTTPYDQWISP